MRHASAAEASMRNPGKRQQNKFEAATVLGAHGAQFANLQCVLHQDRPTLPAYNLRS
jgi:hypothetical protein